MSQLQKKEVFSLAPKSFEEARAYAEYIAKSDVVPKDFKDKPANILVAIQMGMELGLQPLQSLQNIAVINGRPAVWGDSVPALVMNHPKYEYSKEGVVGEGDKRKHFTTVKREGEPEHTKSFGVEDAKQAGLWGKSGPWTTYPDRMMQLRARGFAFRDKFADALKGMITVEEAQDIPIEKSMVDITHEPTSKLESIKSKLGITQQAAEEAEVLPNVESLLTAISSAITKDDLNKVKKASKDLSEEDKTTLREPFNKKNEELSAV